MDNSLTMDKLVALCKGRGFVFPGSDIYGGLANSWDYGPLGVELKENIKREWWKFFVQEAENSVGLDAGILMHPTVWEASGHVGGFQDPLMDCKSCKTRHRADNLIDSVSKGKVNADGWTHEQLQAYIDEKKVNCPNCGKRDWTAIRDFKLMFQTSRGVTEDASSTIYLRPETAQGEYVNFLNVQRSMRLKLPFGIGQIGKAFRNEITPGNFIFRTLEFEQMEHQLFCRAEDSDKHYLEYKKKIWDFYVERLGIDSKNMRYHDHEKLVFYAKAAVDMEYNFCFGWKEINGTHHRGTHDLSQHAKFSGKSQEYVDPNTNEKFVPTIIESSMGLTRAFLVVLHDAYREEQLDDGDQRDAGPGSASAENTRVVLKLKPSLAPYKVAVLPLQKKDLTDKAREVYRDLCKHFMVTYDDTASIGKRYRRQDEIGTPFCVTIDYDTAADGCVTVRDRDSMAQERVAVRGLSEYLSAKLQA